MSDQRKDLPPETATNFGARVRETLQVFLGRRGDPLDRGVTVRDLATLGVAGLLPGARAGMGGGNLAPGGAIDGDASDLTAPPTPEGFKATGGLANVMVECNPAVYTMGRGPGLTVLYGVRRTAGDAPPVFANAVKLAEFSGPVYAFATEPATTWAMWLTWRTRNGVESVAPAGGANGLAVSTGQDSSLLLQTLTGAIRAEQLYESLSDRIDLVDGSMPGSVNARVASEAATREEADGSLQAQYTVKVDLNGYVAGFGLASASTVADGNTSSFAVRADKFYVASPTGPDVAPAVPFIVRTTPSTEGGQTVPPGVYMDGAYIVNMTALYAKIGSLVADSISAAEISAAQLTAGDGTIGGVLKSSNFVSGAQGWRLMPNGTAEMSGAMVRGTVVANAGSIGGVQISANGMSASYVAGSQGWSLTPAGVAEFSNATVRGSVYASAGRVGDVNISGGGLASGAYSGFGWPASGGGFYLGPSGLLLGNYNTGQYFEVTAAGQVYAPGLSIAGGSATFGGTLNAAGGSFSGVLTAAAVNAVNTINIAGNAVTVSNAYAGAFPDWNVGPVLSLYMPQPGWVTVVVTVTSASASAAIRLDSTNVCTVSPAGFQNPAVFLTASLALYVGAGTHNIYATAPGVSGSVTLFGMMK